MRKGQNNPKALLRLVLVFWFLPGFLIWERTHPFFWVPEKTKFKFLSDLLKSPNGSEQWHSIGCQCLGWGLMCARWGGAASSALTTDTAGESLSPLEKSRTVLSRLTVYAGKNLAGWHSTWQVKTSTGPGGCLVHSPKNCAPRGMAPWHTPPHAMLLALSSLRK